MDGYLTKPIRRELLGKEITRVTEHMKPHNEETLAPNSATPEQAWNLKELLDRLDDDQAFLRDLLRVFREDSQSNVQKAKTALAVGDLARLTHAAHTLNGMLRNLCMDGAAEIAAELEDASRQEKRKDAAELLARLEQALGELSPEVEAQLAEVKT